MTWRHWVLLAAMLAIVGVAFLFPAIQQDPAYHNFVDQRAFLGVPNFLNVASNMFFLVVGLMGMRFVLAAFTADKSPFSDPIDRWSYFLFFAAVAGTAFGSSYYHLRPNNETLVWDRLPMSVGFMALLAAIICERMAPRMSYRYILISLPVLGAGSVFYWQMTERSGRGDLRPYAIAQFGSLIAILLLMALFPPRFTQGRDLVVALVIYAAAKGLEAGDRVIYSAGGIVSGHTLKHIAAAIATYWILRMLKLRIPLHLPVR
jgi:hypothetical protein